MSMSNKIVHPKIALFIVKKLKIKNHYYFVYSFSQVKC